MGCETSGFAIALYVILVLNAITAMLYWIKKYLLRDKNKKMDKRVKRLKEEINEMITECRDNDEEENQLRDAIAAEMAQIDAAKSRLASRERTVN